MSHGLNLKGLTFLVADSDKFFVKLLKGILRGFGVTNVVSENDGKRALAMAEGSLVDIVICDAFLPRLDGFALCRALRQSEEQTLRYVPIVVLTSHTQPRNVERARDAGANTVLAKPISPKLLFDRLATLADDPRAFVKSPNYLGPDRRFHDLGPPKSGGRRHDDMPSDEPVDDLDEDNSRARVYSPKENETRDAETTQ